MLSSRVISIAEHILILNTIRVEETVPASNTIIGIDIRNVSTDHFFCIFNLFQEFCTQQISFDRNFTFIYHVLIV